MSISVESSQLRGELSIRLSEDLGRDGSGLGGLSVSGEEKVALAGSDALKI